MKPGFVKRSRRSLIPSWRTVRAGSNWPELTSYGDPRQIQLLWKIFSMCYKGDTCFKETVPDFVADFSVSVIVDIGEEVQIEDPTELDLFLDPFRAIATGIRNGSISSIPAYVLEADDAEFPQFTNPIWHLIPQILAQPYFTRKTSLECPRKRSTPG
jgi:hypothetical protein